MYNSCGKYRYDFDFFEIVLTFYHMPCSGGFDEYVVIVKYIYHFGDVLKSFIYLGFSRVATW